MLNISWHAYLSLKELTVPAKTTQAKLAADALRRNGIYVRDLSFPTYGTKSSAFVEMYLGGELGSSPEDTGAYAASTFLPVTDIFHIASDWQKDYRRDDCVIIACRYTSANAVHQLAKLPRSEWDAFSIGFGISNM